ncbi:MAG: PilZ domain-containing protein [Kofleriaceae bacterium]|nr:PilZ domain-containing protein [Kofleriaceae bacterium]
MTDDRRQHERFELLAQVELSQGAQFETFVTINISAGGLLLRNDRNIHITVGERIRVAINAPELAPPFTLDAMVVRVVAPTSKPGLVAAMWTSSDAAATATLGQILWNLRGR